jgi:hypothetical protein
MPKSYSLDDLVVSLVEMLEDLEFSGKEAYPNTCPLCGNFRRYGHASFCKMAKVLGIVYEHGFISAPPKMADGILDRAKGYGDNIVSDQSLED